MRGYLDGSSTVALLFGPTDLQIDPTTGSFVVADRSNNAIRIVTPSGQFKYFSIEISVL